MIEIEELMGILPQTYPFLMIDRIIDFKKDVSLTAVKNITGNEWCLQGQNYESTHFPETLLIEAASQTGLALYQMSKIGVGEQIPKYILGKIDFKFNLFADIGDQITITAYANKMLDTGGYSEIKLEKDGIKLADGEIIYTVERNKKNV